MIIKPGDYIQHPKCLDWGLGRVRAVSFNGAFSVLFANCGEKTLNFKNLPFQPIKVEPSKDIIVEFDQIVNAKAKEKGAKQSELGRKKIRARHKAFIEKLGLTYSGVRNSNTPNYRTTHCYSCKSYLDSKLDLECIRCGWIICTCGTCGCGYMRL